MPRYLNFEGPPNEKNVKGDPPYFFPKPPFNPLNHLSPEVNVILAVVKQFKQLKRKPRKIKLSLHRCDALPTEL